MILEHHRDGEHPAAVHRDGDRPHRPRAGDRRRLLRGGGRLHRQRGAAGCRHDDPAGASPARVRRGCCPDARCARDGPCRHGGTPCPARARTGCCPVGAPHRDGRPRGAWCRRAGLPAGWPDGEPTARHPPQRPAAPQRVRPARVPPVPRRWRTATAAREWVRPVREQSVPPGRSVPRAPEPPAPAGRRPAWGPTAWGLRGATVRVQRSWRCRHPGTRREASSRRGLRWSMMRNGRIRPVPAVSQLRLSRLYRALSRARVRGPWPHFSCLGPHRVRHEPSISYC